MGKVGISITIDEEVKKIIDILVESGLFKSRSALIEYMARTLLVALKVALITIKKGKDEREKARLFIEAYSEALKKSFEAFENSIKASLSEIMLDPEKSEKIFQLLEID